MRRKPWKLLLREANWWWPPLYGIGGALLTEVVPSLHIDLFPKSFRNTRKRSLLSCLSSSTMSIFPN